MTLPTLEWGALLPELILLATMLVVLMMDLGLDKQYKDNLAYISLGGIILALVGAIWWTPRLPSAFVGMMISDNIFIFFTVIVLISAGLVVLIAPGYLQHIGSDSEGEFYALTLAAAIGMLIMASALSFMMIFLGLEILSLSFYLLSGYLTNKRLSQEAGIKYFILSSFMLAFMLYGIALIYGATGSTGLPQISTFMATRSAAQILGDPILIIGMVLLALGLLFKVSAVPFQWWTPDVYQGAPTPVTAFMSVGTKAAVFAVLLRVYPFALGAAQSRWIGLLWIITVLTMIFGNFMAVPQTNVKRLLAYSSIAQAGYILIGLVADNALGISAMLFYLLVYAFMNIGAFAVVGILERNEYGEVTLDDFNGLAQRHPLLAGVMALCLISLAGLPPTAGFFAKLYIFGAAIASGNLFLALLGILTSLIGLYYYLRIVVAMYMRLSAEPAAAPAMLTAPGKLSLAIAAIGTLALTVFAGTSINLAERTVATLFNLTT